MGTGHVTTLINLIIKMNGFKGPDWYQAGDSSMKPGYIAMEDDLDEIKICTANGFPIGIVGCPSYHDLNTVFTAGEKIPLFPRGCGVVMYVAFDDDTGATTYTRNSILTIDDANAGCAMAWSYTDQDSALTNTLAYTIGYLTQEVTTTADALVYVPCRLSI